MRTVVISDLHLGASLGHDVLRYPLARRLLAERLEGCERLVLLGDLLELREAPLAETLAIAETLLRDIAEAMPGGQVLIVPGNHDRQLAEQWLDRRRLDVDAPPLALEQRFGPGASGPAAWLARRAKGIDIELAYPGVWLRDDVYATHGHYLDCHMTVPRLECLAAAAVARVVGGLPEGPLEPDDYEAILSPLYGFLYALAQSPSRAGMVVRTDLSAIMWSRLHPDGTEGSLRPTAREQAVRWALRRLAIPAAVGAVNLAVPRRFDATLEGPDLRRGGLRAMSETLRRLGVDTGWVVFGHTHRPWPLPGDDEAEAAAPARLVNGGSWVMSRALLRGRAGDSPYWPGTIVSLDADGPPRIERLLDEAEAPALVED